MAACASPPTHWSILPRPESLSISPLVMRSNRVYCLPAPHPRASAREMVIAVMLGGTNIRGSRGLSLAPILDGFGTRSCYPSALICRTSYSFLLPPERTRRCRSSKEKDRCRISPTAAQVWGEGRRTGLPAEKGGALEAIRRH